MSNSDTWFGTTIDSRSCTVVSDGVRYQFSTQEGAWAFFKVCKNLAKVDWVNAITTAQLSDGWVTTASSFGALSGNDDWYWMFKNSPDFRVYCTEPPNAVVRFLANKLLNIEWRKG